MQTTSEKMFLVVAVLWLLIVGIGVGVMRYPSVKAALQWGSKVEHVFKELELSAEFPEKFVAAEEPGVPEFLEMVKAQPDDRTFKGITHTKGFVWRCFTVTGPDGQVGDEYKMIGTMGDVQKWFRDEKTARMLR